MCSSDLDTASGNRWSWDAANTSWKSTGTFTQTITVASTAPGSPATGQLWWNQDYGRLLVYYNDGTSSQWVDASPSDYTSGLAYAQANAVFGVANAAYNTANTFGGVYQVANAAFGKANTALQNTSGTFAGSLIMGGNFSFYGGTYFPQGRITLVTSQPVLTSTQTAKTTIYYTPFIGSLIPIYNGTSTVITPFSELNVVLDITNVVSGNLYDLFVYNDGGTIRLGYGPAWTNSTTRSGAISLINGINTNTSTMTIRYGSSSTTSVTANQATYVGTFYATANGQTGVSFGASGSGGGNPIVGIFNAFNRVPVSVYSLDSSGTYTYNVITWRARGNSTNNRISYVDGLGHISPRGFVVNTVDSSTGNPQLSVALNSTTNPYSVAEIGRAHV